MEVVRDKSVLQRKVNRVISRVEKVRVTEDINY
jgi:hypothetical protein